MFSYTVFIAYRVFGYVLILLPLLGYCFWTFNWFPQWIVDACNLNSASRGLLSTYYCDCVRHPTMMRGRSFTTLNTEKRNTPRKKKTKGSQNKMETYARSLTPFCTTAYCTSSVFCRCSFILITLLFLIGKQDKDFMLLRFMPNASGKCSCYGRNAPCCCNGYG